MEKKTFTVDKTEENIRADKFLSNKIENFSRERLREVFSDGKVSINGNKIKPSKKTVSGEVIEVILPEIKVLEVKPENINIDIIYEDNDVAVINKPQGMVVHPAAGNTSGTLVNALMHHIKDLSGINGIIRPGIVHRIDKDTSGILVVAKNDKSHNHLAAQFKEHSINRHYKALVHGLIHEQSGTVDAPLGRHPVKRKEFTVTNKNAKNAVTHFDVIERYTDYTFIDLHLETGRTHQIRVHMKYINHPVVGDKVYGYNKAIDKTLNGQLLHAYKLGFIHPTTNKYMEFTADLPTYFKKFL